MPVSPPLPIRCILGGAVIALGFMPMASAQSYIRDDGIPDAWHGQTDGRFEGGMMQAMWVPGGGSDLIRNLSVVLTPFWYLDTGLPNLDGQSLRIAVWDDPNGDRDPSDAVLLASSSGHVAQSTATGHFVTYDFPSPVPVSGSFFIGLAIEILSPRSAVGTVDDSQGYRWDSWYFSNDFGPAHLDQLDMNTGPPSNAFLTGRFLVRANDGDYGQPVGQSFCLPLPNSISQRGELTANGNLDQSTGSWRVVLTATRLPKNVFGFFLASQTQVPPRVPANSMGRLCLGGTVLRVGPSLTFADEGSFSWDVDLGNVDSYGASVPGVDVVTAGETWSFQGWHRDNDPGPTSNLTESVMVTFQ